MERAGEGALSGVVGFGRVGPAARLMIRAGARAVGCRPRVAFRAGPAAVLWPALVAAAAGWSAGCADARRDAVGPEGPAWQVVEELRIGSEDAPESAFGQVFDLAAADDGTLYLLDWSAAEVRVFDGAGQFLRRIGRRGFGPGEFAQPMKLELVGDTLWVLDPGNARITVFNRRGEVLGTHTSAGRGGASSWNLVHLLRDGSLLVTASTSSAALAVDPGGQYPVLRVSGAGEAVDTVAWIARENQTLVIRDPGRPGPAGRYEAQPFGDAPIWTVSSVDDALVVVHREASGEPDQAAFEIVKIRATGEPAARRRVRYVPVPLDDALVDETVKAIVRGAKNSPALGGASEREIERWTRDALYVPAWLPPVDRVVVGSDGSIWLRQFQLEPDSGVWYGYDAALRPIGRVTLPPRAVLGEARGPHLWAVVPDTLDVPHVVRFRRVPAREAR